MSYTKTIWENDITPVSASNMNKIEDQLEQNTEEIQKIKTYSSTETIVGTWVDNKPIYRKVYIFDGNWAANATGSFSVADLNIDTCISLRGYLTSSTYAHIGLDFYNTSFNYVYMNAAYTIYWKVAWASTKNTFIIEYTKKTTN